jgi:hypothetical protein
MEQISQTIADGVQEFMAQQEGRPYRNPILAEMKRQERILSRSPEDHAERLAKMAAKLARRAKTAV